MTRGRVERFALVAGGGTAGHVVPALAVAEALVNRRGPGAVELVGARRGLEATMTGLEGLPVTLLGGRGLSRRTDPASLLANAGAVAGLAGAALAALGIVARRRPAVVVSVGGYASVPTALAAVALGVPVVVCNVDAVPGLANRLVGRVARAAAVAYPETALPRARCTGAPVRAEVAALAGTGPSGPRSEVREALGVPANRVMVAVVGGSLGARRVNEAVLALAAAWSGRDDVALYHVVGRRDAPWAADQAAALHVAGLTGGPGSLWYRQVAFEERMDLVYQAADVVVGRAGAMTVAELAVVGLPAVLVPLPGAPGDHQGANAAVLEAAGAAAVVPDDECDAAHLAACLDPLVADPARRRSMARSAGRLGRPDAADAVVSLAEAHARPGRWPR
ncbi:MAG: glycosyltransferase [Actinomycetota bacterium]|nr:glycosyltransferase [Actinomycetota bacterium]